MRHTIQPGIFRRVFVAMITCLIATSCTEDTPSVSTEDADKVNPILTAGRHTLEELVDQYSGSNVAGVINLYEWNYDILRQSVPGSSPWESRTFVTSSGDATFFNLAQQTLTSAGIITVNDIFFKELQTGSYQDWSLSDEPGLDVNFGIGANKVFLAGTTDIPRTEETVSFASAPVITNISRGQQVSRSADLHVLWTGSNSGYVEVGINADNAIAEPQTGQTSGIVQFIDNDGSATLSTSGLQSLPNGIVEVYVWQFEPVPVALSNGQQIFIVGMSIHEVSIELID